MESARPVTLTVFQGSRQSLLVEHILDVFVSLQLGEAIVSLHLGSSRNGVGAPITQY